MNTTKNLNISLKGIGIANPDKFISSDEIEHELRDVYHRLKLPFGRIEMQTGIKTRGVFVDKRPSTISAMAAKDLFQHFDYEPADVDLIIHASVCRDFLEPSTASVVHHLLDLRSDCFSFDLSNACLGVLSALEVASNMINNGSIQNALIVSGENSKPLLDQTIKTLNGDENLTRKSIKKYFANFTIGSAGVAFLVGKAGEGIAQFGRCASLSDTSAYDLCQGDGSTDSLVMETNSEELMHKGVALAQNNWMRFNSVEKTQFDHLICHQVGIQHQKFLYQSLELDFDKDYSSFQDYGNTGSAALPLTLALAIKNDIFNSNDMISLLGIGSGLHTTMMELEWN